MIATNSYLFPEEYVRACIPLLDDCPTTDFSIMKHHIERELGKPLSSVFKSVDEKPIASASLAQVHKATLLTGEEVAIKI